MTNEELRKLKRGDLLELLVAQAKETEALQKRLDEVEAELENRQIRLDEAGSIAQAALQINGVFEAAQAAADQYLESVREQNRDVEALCARREKEAQEKADRMIADAEAKCAAMVAQAEKESQDYWDMLSRRLEDFYNEHAGLRELLASEQLKHPVSAIGESDE